MYLTSDILVANVKRKTAIMINFTTQTKYQESIIPFVLCSKLTFSFYEILGMTNAILSHISYFSWEVKLMVSTCLCIFALQIARELINNFL
jgi:hypothetical protein